jgi:hypothetical protein
MASYTIVINVQIDITLLTNYCERINTDYKANRNECSSMGVQVWPAVARGSVSGRITVAVIAGNLEVGQTY